MASITRSIQFCLDVCNDPDVGYSLDTTGAKSRTLYQNQNGPPYYCDCSSLMCYSVLAGGFTMSTNTIDSAPFSTADEPTALKSAGWVDIGSPAEIRPGDIAHIYKSERLDKYGVNSGHTEMCLTGGKKGEAIFMGAHTDSASWENQVCVDSSPFTQYTRIFRYEGEDDETGETNPTPRSQMSFFVAAAIAGNMYQESGINPGIWEFHDGRGFEPETLSQGFGLGQWTNTGGDTNGRLYQLLTWLDSHGYGRASGVGQVNFLINEDHWQTYFDWQKEFDINSLTEFLYSDSEDIEFLTTAYCYCWEGISPYNVDPDDVKMDVRIQWANFYYDYIQEHWEDEDITVWYSQDASASQEQRNNNAVMLFRALNNFTMAQDGDTGNSGNSGGGDGGQPEEDNLSFTDFLYSKLGRSKSGLYIPLHIINKRR